MSASRQRGTRDLPVPVPRCAASQAPQGPGGDRAYVNGRITVEEGNHGVQYIFIQGGAVAQSVHARLPHPFHRRTRRFQKGIRGPFADGDQAVGCRPADALPVAVQRLGEMLYG